MTERGFGALARRYSQEGHQFIEKMIVLQTLVIGLQHGSNIGSGNIPPERLSHTANAAAGEGAFYDGRRDDITKEIITEQ